MLIGCDSSGTPFNGTGKFVYSSNVSGSDDGLFFNQVSNFAFDIEMISTNSGDDGFRLGSSSAESVLVRCLATGGWGSGYRVQSGRCSFIECTSVDSALGFEATNSLITHIGCQAIGSTSHGFSTTQINQRYLNCTSLGSLGAGYSSTSTSSSAVNMYINSLAYDSADSGFEWANNTILLNCTSTLSGIYNYEDTDGTASVLFLANCHSHLGTSGHTNLSGTWADISGGNNITGDPLFTSVVGGSEDWTPQSGSPLLGVGVPTGWGMTTNGVIGPLPGAAGGGGGSTRLVGSGGLIL